MDKNTLLYQEDLRQVLSIDGIERLKGKSFLITGATGMIGMHLIDALMLLGDIRIYAVGRSKDKAKGRLGEYYDSPLFTFIEQDVCNPLPDVETDYIVPLASNTHPLLYSQYPIETLLTNIKGVENALNLALRSNATVLYTSTVEVYGDSRGEDVFDEDYTGVLNLSNSRACYPESKRVSEALCQSFIAEKGLNVKIVRLSRIFGPTMLMSDSKASSQFIKKAVSREDIVLKSKGNQYFSYCYVSDTVNAMLYVLLYGEVGIPYNISSEKCNVLLRDFANICAGYNGRNVLYDVPSETERKGYSNAMKAVLDNSRLKSIGWHSAYDIVESIRRTIEILKG